MKGGTRYGAGRPALHGKAEHCLRLDVRRLAQSGLLQHAGVSGWQWTENETGATRASISIAATPHRLTLTYTASGAFVSEPVDITRTPCHYGGQRPWFRCPCCRARVAVLYLKAGRFRCRKCQRLRYVTQGMDTCARTWRKQSKLEAKLDTHGRKPKGMHWRTYERISQGIMQCEMARDDALYLWCQQRGLVLD